MDPIAQERLHRAVAALRAEVERVVAAIEGDGARQQGGEEAGQWSGEPARPPTASTQRPRLRPL